MGIVHCIPWVKCVIENVNGKFIYLVYMLYGWNANVVVEKYMIVFKTLKEAGGVGHLSVTWPISTNELRDMAAP